MIANSTPQVVVYIKLCACMVFSNCQREFINTPVSVRFNFNLKYLKVLATFAETKVTFDSDFFTIVTNKVNNEMISGKTTDNKNNESQNEYKFSNSVVQGREREAVCNIRFCIYSTVSAKLCCRQRGVGAQESWRRLAEGDIQILYK